MLVIYGSGWSREGNEKNLFACFVIRLTCGENAIDVRGVEIFAVLDWNLISYEGKSCAISVSDAGQSRQTSRQTDRHVVWVHRHNTVMCYNNRQCANNR